MYTNISFSQKKQRMLAYYSCAHGGRKIYNTFHISMLRLSLRLFKFSTIPQQEFLRLAEHELQRLSIIAEKYEQREVDIFSTLNILSIKARGNTIVVNTQTPNRQLWYSSTLSGPQRFNWASEQWINGQNQQLGHVFEEDILAMLKS